MLDLLNTSADIMRLPATKDAYGKPSGSRTKYKTIMGRLDSSSGRELTKVDGTANQINYVFYSLNEPVSESDVLRISGIDYSIIAVRPVTDFGGGVHHLEIDLIRVA
jgi:hypothetical protein